MSNIKHLNNMEILKKLGLPTLEYRRERADLIQVYKILNSTDLLEKDKFFKTAQYRQTWGQQLKLYKQRSRLNARTNSFSIRVVNNWEALPEAVVNSPT